MDEAELTRKAIAEIMREMDAQKEADKLPTVRERKLNPLGRPNTDFLDRTLNSVMTHNKRQLERNHRKCQNKLRDLDEAKEDEQHKRQSRDRYRTQRKIRRKRRYSSDTTSSSSSSRRDSSSSKERKPKHRKKKKKKNRNKKKAISSSSSLSSISIDSSSSSSTSTSSNKNSRKQRKANHEYNDAYHENGSFYPNHDEQLDPVSLGYYVDPNMALAAMAYNHMNQILQQQQQSMQDLVKEELEHNDSDDNNKVDIPSDLSLTYHSESELNISLNSSSAEEDENGVLTFKLTSDEEQTNNKTAKESAVRKKKLPTKRQRRINVQRRYSSGTSPEAQITSRKQPIVDEEITLISSSSKSDSEQDVVQCIEVITTILSSSSSSSDNEDMDKIDEITILSSCTSSSDTEKEATDTKNQKETNRINQDKNVQIDTESIQSSSDLIEKLNNKKEEVLNETIDIKSTTQQQIRKSSIIDDELEIVNLSNDSAEEQKACGIEQVAEEKTEERFISNTDLESTKSYATNFEAPVNQNLEKVTPDISEVGHISTIDETIRLKHSLLANIETKKTSSTASKLNIEENATKERETIVPTKHDQTITHIKSVLHEDDEKISLEISPTPNESVEKELSTMKANEEVVGMIDMNLETVTVDIGKDKGILTIEERNIEAKGSCSNLSKPNSEEKNDMKGTEGEIKFPTKCDETVTLNKSAEFNIEDIINQKKYEKITQNNNVEREILTLRAAESGVVTNDTDQETNTNEICETSIEEGNHSQELNENVNVAEQTEEVKVSNDEPLNVIIEDAAEVV